MLLILLLLLLLLLLLSGRPEQYFREVICFTRDVFFSPRNLRAPSADRRKTLPRNRKLAEFYIA